jgi:hypothetical protein
VERAIQIFAGSGVEGAVPLRCASSKPPPLRENLAGALSALLVFLAVRKTIP